MILKYDINVKSIILYGSYGRGEGALIKKGKYILPYNDYDILLIVDKEINQNTIASIKVALKDLIEINWIDISQLTIYKLKALKPSIFNYDLKYGSKVIWGDESVLENIPEIKTNDITLKDAEVLYFTRIWTFLGSIDKSGFSDNNNDIRLFRYQMSKALFAVIDILLLQKGCYHQSYKERVKILKKHYPEKINIIKFSEWALKEKLQPLNVEMTTKEMKTLYKSVLKIYIDEMYIVLSKYYNRNVYSTKDIEISIKYSLSEELLKLKYFIKTRSWDYNKRNNIRLAQSYFIESTLKTSDEKIECLNRVNTLIKRNNKNLIFDIYNWDQMRMILISI